MLLEMISDWLLVHETSVLSNLDHVHGPGIDSDSGPDHGPAHHLGHAPRWLFAAYL